LHAVDQVRRAEQRELQADGDDSLVGTKCDWLRHPQQYWVKYTARGFRNDQNFVNAIYFHCGGLDLAP
jgi:hypothetical protein